MKQLQEANRLIGTPEAVRESALASIEEIRFNTQWHLQELVRLNQEDRDERPQQAAEQRGERMER